MVWVDSFSNYHIDAIMHGGTERAWQLTGFYGEPETSRRSEGWNMLRMLSTKPLTSYWRWQIKREVHHNLII